MTVFRLAAIRSGAAVCLIALALAAGSGSLLAQDSSDKPDSRNQQTSQVVERGVNYLLSKGQSADGSYSSQTGAGVTAICTTALLRNGRSPNDPAVRSLGATG